MFLHCLRTSPETLTYGKLNYRKKVPELNVINESDMLETFTKIANSKAGILMMQVFIVMTLNNICL